MKRLGKREKNYITIDRQEKVTSFCDGDGDGDDIENGAEENAGVGDGDDIVVGSTAAAEGTGNNNTVDDRTDEGGIDNNDLPDEILEDGDSIDDDANMAADDTINDDGSSENFGADNTTDDKVVSDNAASDNTICEGDAGDNLFTDNNIDGQQWQLSSPAFCYIREAMENGPFMDDLPTVTTFKYTNLILDYLLGLSLQPVLQIFKCRYRTKSGDFLELCYSCKRTDSIW